VSPRAPEDIVRPRRLSGASGRPLNFAVRLHKIEHVTPSDAIAFIRGHGVVLEAAAGSVPTLVEAIVGTPIRGSWWSHPRGKEIFQVTRAVRSSQQILVCRLVSGKVTFVHRKLWPALVRSAGRFPLAHLARLSEEHTSSGRHVVKAIPFPAWVPASVSVQAGKLTEHAALGILRSCIRGVDLGAT
jgi:hypothetical protein